MLIIATKQHCTEPRLSKGSKKLEGNRIRTSDLNWSRGYSIPYGIMQKNYKIERSSLGGQELSGMAPAA